MRGCIDGLSGERVSGWAARDAAGAPARVEVEIDGRLVASGTADGLRADFAKAGVGDGRVGFALDLPLTGAPRHALSGQLAVYASGPNAGVRARLPLWHRLAAQIEEERALEEIERLPVDQALEIIRARPAMKPGDAVSVALDRLLARLPNHPGVAHEAARRCLASGELVAAERIASRAHAKSHAPELLLIRAEIAYARERYADAVAVVERMTARSEEAESLLRRARRRLERGHGGLRTRARYEVAIDGGFKWGTSSFPHWGAVFVGTTDSPVSDLDAIVEQLSCFDPAEIELVTIVGGMFFLRLLERLSFKRITVFDSNINELGKMALARDLLLATPHRDFDGFAGLDDAINRSPEQFYLPHSLKDAAMVRLGDASFHYEGRLAPIVTVMSPVDFPELTWSPSEAGYDNAVRNLRDAFNPRLHLGIPRLNAERRLVVAFLTHVRELTADVLAERIHNAGHIVPIYARGGKNERALDPHGYWQFRVNQLVHGTSLHVWSPEDQVLLGGHYDKRFTHATTCERYLTGGAGPAETAVLHILVGKCADPEAVGRWDLFRAVALRAFDSHKRVVVTESAALEHRLAVELAALAPARWQLARTAYAPGQGQRRRNLFMVYERG